jgi:hypothetical protein
MQPTSFFCLLIGVLFCLPLSAQDKVELKINGGGLFFGSRTVAVEYLANPKLGLQFATRIYQPGLTIQTGSTVENNLRTQYFDRDAMILRADARWYPAPNHGPNTRWFLGGQLRADLTLDYDSRYDRVYANNNFGDRPDGIDGLNSLSAGLVGGYKALVSNRIVIEPSVTLTRASLSFGDNAPVNSGLGFRLFLGVRL